MPMSPDASRLLAADEPPPVSVRNVGGASPFLFVVDHAGNRIPRVLGDLGVSAAERVRHIACDIGIAAVAGLVGDALDAALIEQTYSRLVIDCNRTPESETSIPEISELTPIPGNANLSQSEKADREREIFRPYHEMIAAVLDRRHEAGRATALIALHSFTPVFKGAARHWDIGIMYNRDPRFAHILMKLLAREEALIIGDNEPYSLTDATDYTIPVHGERRGLHHVAIEIRQDLIEKVGGQRAWAARLAQLLPLAYQEMVAAATLRPV
jgi:predicted N-formylglutamate amidohydrolase